MTLQTLEVGGLPIAFHTDEKLWGKSLRPFESRKRPVLTVDVSFSGEPRHLPGRETFSPEGDFFRISKEKKGLLITFPPRPQASAKALLIRPSISRATLFLRDQKAVFSDETSSPSWLILLMRYLLTRRGGAFVHACGLIDRGEGFLFVGPPESGKSTMARLFHGEKEMVVLNDEWTVARKIGKKFYLFGTPWHGSSPFFANRKAPLEALFFLTHGRENCMTPLSPKESIGRLLPETGIRAWDPEGAPFLATFSLELCAALPAYELAFVPDKTVVRFFRQFRQNGLLRSGETVRKKRH